MLTALATRTELSERCSPGIVDLLAALPDLAGEARARSVEFEGRRSLAPDFTDKLKRAGAFRILVPTDAGGLGGSLLQWLDVVTALAEADASTGWYRLMPISAQA